MAQARYICMTARTAASGAAAPRPQGPLWRLVGANNRELGRMPFPAPIGAVCCEAVGRLREELARTTPRIKLAGPGSSWTWALELDDEVVAVSGRAYLRQRECQYSLAQFLAVAGDAVVSHAQCQLTEGRAG